MRRLTLLLAGVLVLASVPNARAQADLGLRGAGVQLGIVSPDDVDATLGLELFADFGTFAPYFGLEGHFDYWKKTEDIGGGGEASVRDIVFGARGKYIFPTRNPAIRPFVGSGLGIHFLRAEVDVPAVNVGGIIIGGSSYSDNDTKLGLDIGGGLNAAIGPRADFVGEFWYSFVPDVSQVSLTFGVLYKM